MCKFFIFCLFLITFLDSNIVNASESLPRKEFISITEQVVDALDEIESALTSSNDFLIEAAFHKYAIADKKYNRYLKGSWKGEQGKIALALFDAHLDFDIMHRRKNLRTIPLGEISQSYQNGVISKNKAIDLFRKYKNKKL